MNPTRSILLSEHQSLLDLQLVPNAVILVRVTCPLDPLLFDISIDESDTISDATTSEGTTSTSNTTNTTSTSSTSSNTGEKQKQMGKPKWLKL